MVFFAHLWPAQPPAAAKPSVRCYCPADSTVESPADECASFIIAHPIGQRYRQSHTPRPPVCWLRLQPVNRRSSWDGKITVDGARPRIDDRLHQGRERNGEEHSPIPPDAAELNNGRDNRDCVQMYGFR